MPLSIDLCPPTHLCLPLLPVDGATSTSAASSLDLLHPAAQNPLGQDLHPVSPPIPGSTDTKAANSEKVGPPLLPDVRAPLDILAKRPASDS